MTSQLQEYAMQAQNWLQHQALPFWADHGVDSISGGFCEQVEFNGQGNRQADKRILVQGRQIYTYSHAAAAGIFDGLAFAQQAVNFINQCGWSEDRGWVHLLSADGKVTRDSSRRSYDHAFLLLALGWFHNQQQDRTSKAILEQTLTYLDDSLKADSGYNEAIQGVVQLPRRQNPHMHLFEAFVALHRLSGERHYLERADAIFHLFETVFFDANATVVREFFTENWKPDPQTYDRIEPGHMMEWVWLLRQYQKQQPQADIDHYCYSLFHKAIAIGYDHKHKVLLDCVDPGGKVLLASRRCWPQTEGIKAALVQYQHTGDNFYKNLGEDLLASLFNHYLAQCPAGGWRDTFDADMNSMADTIPASTLYHIFLSFQQLIELHGDK